MKGARSDLIPWSHLLNPMGRPLDVVERRWPGFPIAANIFRRMGDNDHGHIVPADAIAFELRARGGAAFGIDPMPASRDSFRRRF
jgi:hypothetical protein